MVGKAFPGFVPPSSKPRPPERAPGRPPRAWPSMPSKAQKASQLIFAPAYIGLAIGLVIGLIQLWVTPAQWPWHAVENAQQLDEQGLAFLFPNFLSDAEVAFLRRNYPLHPQESPPPGYQSTAVTKAQYRESEVLRAIEDRIANVTGVPEQDAEGPLRVSVQRGPWPENGPHGPTSPDDLFLNLHHDTIQAPERVATVLMYLSDFESDGVEGGDTMWPCVVAKGAKAVPDPSLCARLRPHLDAGRLFLAPPAGVMRQECFDAQAARQVSALCARSPDGPEQRGDAPALRVTPRRGAALFFTSKSPEDGSLLPSMWHGPCRVRNGEKFTLQKFKSVPLLGAKGGARAMRQLLARAAKAAGGIDLNGDAVDDDVEAALVASSKPMPFVDYAGLPLRLEQAGQGPGKEKAEL